jgi:hypothetical protein
MEVVPPRLDVPGGWLFGHRTHLVDSWTADIERIWLPAFAVETPPFAIEVAPGNTRALGIAHWTGHPARRWRRRGTLDLGDTLVYDARYEVMGNIAHVLDYVATRVLLARKLLEEHAEEPRIVVIVPDAAPAVCRTVFGLLGFETIQTDREVSGRIVRVPHQAFRALHPVLFAGDFPGYETGTPPRVYLSRRGSRAVANEDELWPHLASLGFVRLFFEDIPVARQWSIVRNAHTIVAIHGAALAALLWAVGRPERAHPPQLIEIFGAGYLVNMYRQVAASIGARWAGVRGLITSRIVRDLDERRLPRNHEKARFRVDMKCIEAALAEMKIC